MSKLIKVTTNDGKRAIFNTDDISVALETDLMETTVFVRGVGPLKLGVGLGTFWDALNGTAQPEATKGLIV